MASPFGKLSDLQNDIATFKRESWNALYPLLALADIVIDDVVLAQRLNNIVGDPADFTRKLRAAQEFIKTNFS